MAQEIDIPTGLVLFQWDSLDHVPLSAGYTQAARAAHIANGIGNPYDYFHINSIALDRDGNLLISARNTWAVYKVNHHTGGGHLDAGRQALELQARARRLVRLPARRPGSAPRVIRS